MIQILFGMNQHVDQNLSLRRMGKLYEHKTLIIDFKVLEPRWHSKVKVFLNGMSLLRRIVHLLGLEYVHPKVSIVKSLQDINLLDGYWVLRVHAIIQEVGWVFVLHLKVMTTKLLFI